MRENPPGDHSSLQGHGSRRVRRGLPRPIAAHGSRTKEGEFQGESRDEFPRCNETVDARTTPLKQMPRQVVGRPAPGHRRQGEAVYPRQKKERKTPFDGYVPGEPNTDKGGVELDVLNDWQKNGFAGNPLLAFVDPKASNLTQVRQSIALFGGVYIGLSMPVTAQRQNVWDVVPNGGANARPGSWGGHCVFVPRYDQKTFTCITWGQLKTMTVAFWNKYCDEAHTLLSPAWISTKGAPSGFDLAQLQADLQAIV
jgi:hypothetical protein